MIGNAIIVTAHPIGKRIEGYIYGTPKPGTVVSVKAATEPVKGAYTWEPFNKGADGDRGLIAILLPDKLQGKTEDDAYASGDRCFLYLPVYGDLLNMRVANISGTADAFAIGDSLMVDQGTGKLIATTGTPKSAPFECLETSAALTEDKLLLCAYTGQ